MCSLQCRENTTGRSSVLDFRWMLVIMRASLLLLACSLDNRGICLPTADDTLTADKVEADIKTDLSVTMPLCTTSKLLLRRSVPDTSCSLRRNLQSRGGGA